MGDSRKPNAPMKQIRANIVFWTRKFRRGSAADLFAENESNLRRAIELGLSEKTTSVATGALLARLFPHIQKSKQLKVWLQYYEILIRSTKFPRPTMFCRLVNQLGCLYWQCGRPASALIEFRKARDLAQQHGLYSQEAVARIGISATHWLVRDFKKAWDVTKETNRSLALKLRGGKLWPRMMAAKGAAAFSLHKYKIAETCFTKAGRMAKTYERAFKLQMRINKAMSLSRQGFFSSALRHMRYTEKLLTAKKGLGHLHLRFLILKALILYEKGSDARARHLIEQAFLIRDAGGDDVTTRALLETLLGRINARESEPQKAEKYLESATLLWERSGNQWMLFDTVRTLGELPE